MKVVNVYIFGSFWLISFVGKPTLMGRSFLSQEFDWLNCFTAEGGEGLDAVMGRNEEEELPYFTPGAFEVMVPETEERRALFNKTMLDRLIPVDSITQHTMHHLFEQIRTVPVDEVVCAQVIWCFF